MSPHESSFFSRPWMNRTDRVHIASRRASNAPHHRVRVLRRRDSPAATISSLSRVLSHSPPRLPLEPTHPRAPKRLSLASTPRRRTASPRVLSATPPAPRVRTARTSSIHPPPIPSPSSRRADAEARARRPPRSSSTARARARVRTRATRVGTIAARERRCRTPRRRRARRRARTSSEAARGGAR